MHHQLLSIISPTIISNLRHSIFIAITLAHTLVHATIIAHLGFCQSLFIFLLPSFLPTNHFHICRPNNFFINQIISLIYLTLSSRLTLLPEDNPSSLLWFPWSIWLPMYLSVLLSHRLLSRSHTGFVKFFKHVELISKSGLPCPSFSPRFLYVWLLFTNDVSDQRVPSQRALPWFSHLI